MSRIFLIGSAAIELLPVRPTMARKIETPIVSDDGGIVPIGYVSDCASIPRWAWSVIGHPFEGQFIRPAYDHDIRCELHVGRWQDVHDRFLATLEAEGVGRTRRTLMHRAVWYFGPRWPVHQSITVADLAEIAHRPVGPNGRWWGDYPGRAA